jgi:hypothetical protein
MTRSHRAEVKHTREVLGHRGDGREQLWPAATPARYGRAASSTSTRGLALGPTDWASERTVATRNALARIVSFVKRH